MTRSQIFPSAELRALVMAEKPRLAIVVSHPIQHFCPQYASLAKHEAVQLKVFFASALGLKPYADKDFSTEISWTNLQLDQFEHCFLNGEAALPADKTLDAPGLEAALQAYQPDLVVVYGYFQPLQRRAYRWARRWRAKLAYVSDTERRQRRNPLREWLKYPFLRKYLSTMDYLLTVGDANEACARYYGVPQSKLVRMHFPIDINLYSRSFSERDGLRNKYREQFAIADDEIVLAVTGKLVAWKRQGDIIDAMAWLEARNVVLRLFVIGSGEMQPALEKKARKLRRSKVHITGFVKPEELPGYYAASDLYVHPASIEPHSLAISEAIYMGLAVVISDRCGSYGPSDDVQDGQNGYVYECGNIEELASRIAALAGNAGLRHDFAEYSHRIAAAFQQRSHGDFLYDLLPQRFQ